MDYKEEERKMRKTDRWAWWRAHFNNNSNKVLMVLSDSSSDKKKLRDEFISNLFRFNYCLLGKSLIIYLWFFKFNAIIIVLLIILLIIIYYNWEKRISGIISLTLKVF